MSAHPATTPAVAEWRQVLAVARLEMYSYVRSWPGLVFALFMPTTLLLLATAFWYPDDARQSAPPDMVVLSVLTSGLFSIGVAMTEQRKDGTLKTYLSSPLRARTYLAGQIVDRVSVTLVGNTVMIAVALLLLDIPFTGSALLFPVTVVLALATMLSFGFMLASRFRTVEAAGATSSGLFFVIMLASGYFTDVDTWYPAVVRVLDLLPFKPLVDVMRATWLDPRASVAIGDLAVVVVWFVVFAFAASRLFRWTPDDQ